MPSLPDWTRYLLLALEITGISSGHWSHTLLAFFAVLGSLCTRWIRRRGSVRPRPISINYHFHRQCTRSCNVCTRSVTASESHKLPIKVAKVGLRRLRAAGMRALHFTGEEPFLEPDYLGALVQYCKEVLGVETVSVSTDGSLIKERWLERYGEFVDVLLVPCKSFTNATLLPLQKLKQICQMCKQHGILFECQTDVDTSNYREDMNLAIQNIDPQRWICYPTNQNDSKRTAQGLDNREERHAVTEEHFRSFCERHGKNGCFRPCERRSEVDLHLDEEMRIVSMDSSKPADSILEAGALERLDRFCRDDAS